METRNNDYWHIDNIELYPDALVEVFNRWGDRVYSTKKYVNAWEGAWQVCMKIIRCHQRPIIM